MCAEEIKRVSFYCVIHNSFVIIVSRTGSVRYTSDRGRRVVANCWRLIAKLCSRIVMKIGWRVRGWRRSLLSTSHIAYNAHVSTFPCKAAYAVEVSDRRFRLDQRLPTVVSRWESIAWPVDNVHLPVTLMFYRIAFCGDCTYRSAVDR